MNLYKDHLGMPKLMNPEGIDLEDVLHLENFLGDIPISDDIEHFLELIDERQDGYVFDTEGYVVYSQHENVIMKAKYSQYRGIITKNLIISLLKEWYCMID